MMMQRSKIIAIAIILGFGAARLPFEKQLASEQRAAMFHAGSFQLSSREQLGQMGMAAALSGFRAPLADYLWIRAHMVWENLEWERMVSLLDTTTKLQPRVLHFWQHSAWQTGWNMSIAKREDKKLPGEAFRIRAQKECFELAADFLWRGIRYNPDRAASLYDNLGLLYREKFKDHAKSFTAYELCSFQPGAPEYARRFAAYALARTPGHEKEAYRRISELFREGQSQRMPTLLSLARKLEDTLGIPDSDRLVEEVKP